MKKFIFFFISGVIFFQIYLFSYQKNNEIFDTLAIQVSESVTLFLKQNSCLKIVYNKNPQAISGLLQNRIAHACQNQGIRMFSADSSTNETCRLDVIVKDFALVYSNHSNDDDLLIRTVNCNLLFNLTKQGGEIKTTEFSKLYKDTIPRTELEHTQNSSWEFANARLPEPPRSFFREILEPVLVVSAAVLTVILLFSVRSK